SQLTGVPRRTLYDRLKRGELESRRNARGRTEVHVQSVRDVLRGAGNSESRNTSKTNGAPRPHTGAAQPDPLAAERVELEALRVERERESVLAEVQRKRAERIEQERAAAESALEAEQEQLRDVEHRVAQREERKRRQAQLESALEDAGSLIRYDESCRALGRHVFLAAMKA